MSSMVSIGGVTVDLNDPCAVLTELRKAQLAIATGESVAMTRFGQDEVRFTATSSARLDKLIVTYEGLCAKAQGRRNRFAARAIWI